MDYTSSLFLLRDFTIRKQAICVRDDLILFGHLAFRKTARTNYLVDWFDYGYGLYHQRERRYYTLDCVVFLLHHTHLGHVEYHRKAAEARICTEMKDSDWQILLAYLHGSVPTTSSIDYAFVPGPGDLPVPLGPRPDFTPAPFWIAPAVPIPDRVSQPVPASRPPEPKPLAKPVTAPFIQRDPKSYSRWTLCPGVKPSDFPVPPELAPRQATPVHSKEKKDKTLFSQPSSAKQPKKSKNQDAKYPDDWISSCAKSLPGLTGDGIMVLRGFVEDALRAKKKRNFSCLNAVFEFTVAEAKRQKLNPIWDCFMVRKMLDVGLRLGYVDGCNGVFRLKGAVERQLQQANEQGTAGPKVPTITPADFIPPIASALRTLNNPAGSTAPEIQRSIQEFLFSEAVNSAAGKKLKYLIATTVALAVTNGVVVRNKVPLQETRYRLCPALASTCFRECPAAAALRRTEKVTTDDDCIVIDDEEIQSGNLGVDHGELWALTDRALKALEKTEACNGQVIFGTVSMLKESDSDKMSPWKYEDIEAVLLWGRRMGIYVRNGDRYRMAGSAVPDKVLEKEVCVVMDVDSERQIHAASEEGRNSDHGGVSLPSSDAECSSTTQSQKAVKPLPSVFRSKDIGAGTIGCSFSDCSTVPAPQMAAYQSFAASTYR